MFIANLLQTPPNYKTIFRESEAPSGRGLLRSRWRSKREETGLEDVGTKLPSPAAPTRRTAGLERAGKRKISFRLLCCVLDTAGAAARQCRVLIKGFAEMALNAGKNHIAQTASQRPTLLRHPKIASGASALSSRFFDRGHSSRSLFPPQAAVALVPTVAF